MINHVKRGRTISCGCINHMNLPSLRSDGQSYHELYAVWMGMMRRCYDVTCPKYMRYGGRGISVHLPWHSAKTFIEQVGPRPSKDLQIDRINNDGNYEPGNVRWATRTENIRNRSITYLVMYKGKMTPIAEVVMETGISRSTLQSRIQNGDVDIFRPPAPRKRAATPVTDQAADQAGKLDGGA